jgi:succinate dehydrogenase (ubiquinone) cytochrome b560 subunit
MYPGLAYEVLNKRRGRPLAPFLSSYKMHFAMFLSILNRVTGGAYSALFYAAVIYLGLFAPPFPELLAWLQDLHLNPVLVMGAKFVFAWGVMYHTWDGLRHLAWDVGSGFNLRTVVRTGKAVVVLTTLSAIYLCTL